jgi:hypothetical protein
MVLGPTHSPIQWLPGPLSLGIKRPGREADHSPQFSAEVKNAWGYTSTPQYVLMAWCLVKHRDSSSYLTYIYNSVQPNRDCCCNMDCVTKVLMKCLYP